MQLILAAIAALAPLALGAPAQGSHASCNVQPDVPSSRCPAAASSSAADFANFFGNYWNCKNDVNSGRDSDIGCPQGYKLKQVAGSSADGCTTFNFGGYSGPVVVKGGANFCVYLSTAGSGCTPRNEKNQQFPGISHVSICVADNGVCLWACVCACVYVYVRVCVRMTRVCGVLA